MNKNLFEFTLVEGDKKKKMSIEKISFSERKNKKHIITTYGEDISHCYFIGSRHYKGDFFKETKKYYIYKKSDKFLKKLQQKQPNSIKVEFYGK